MVAALAADVQNIVKTQAFEARLEVLSMTPFAWPCGTPGIRRASFKRLSDVAAAADIQPE